MASAKTTLKFDTEFEPDTGTLVEIAPGIARLTAPNSGPYTFTGTNSFFIGNDVLAIIDPGPDDEAHLSALLKAINKRPVEAIILSHTHKDHSSLTKKLVRATGAPVWFEGKHRLSRAKRLFEFNVLKPSCDWELTPDRYLIDEEILSIGGVQMQVMTTPGHCANHLSFGIVGSEIILSGDHVMGWNSTLVATPDGSMSDYLLSLDKIIEAEWTRFLPAHGKEIENSIQYAIALRAHRDKRNGQIVAALKSGKSTTGKLLDRIYPHIKGRLRIAAYLTLVAHLEYLVGEGKIISRLSLGGRIYEIA